MTRAHTYILGLIVLTLVAVACGTRPMATLSPETASEADDIVLARTNVGYKMTAAEFYDKLRTSRLLMPGGTIEQERAAFLRDSILLDTLAGFEADRIDLSKHYLDYVQYKKQYQDFLLSRYWEETLYKKTDADSAEIVAFYEENSELFAVPEQIDLYHILSSPYGMTVGPDSNLYKDMERDKLWEASKEYIDKLHQLLDWGEPFENVAYFYSHDRTSREEGGHVGWTTAGVYRDPFDSIAFSLEPGTYSEPYRDRDGWHIIYVAGHVPAGPLPLDSSQVWESARQSLLTHKSNQELEARLDSMRQAMEITPREPLLDTNLFLVEDSAWVVIINGQDTIDARYAKQFEDGYRRQYDVDNTTPDIKMEMYREAGMRYAQIQAARAAGIDTLPDVVAARKQIRHHRAKSVVQSRAYDPDWKPHERAIETYYQRNIEQFVPDATLKLQSITVGDSSFAEFLRDQALSGLTPLDLVEQYDEDEGPLNIRYKDLGWVDEEQIDPRMRINALRASLGGYSPVYRNSNGDFEFVRLMDRRDVKTLELARGEINTTMLKRHRRQVWEDYRDNMFKTYAVRTPTQIGTIELARYRERVQQ